VIVRLAVATVNDKIEKRRKNSEKLETQRIDTENQYHYNRTIAHRPGGVTMSESQGPQAPEPRPEPRREETALVVAAQQLFQGKREIWIEHEGERYRLRITRRNRLILQK
jgi:hemin uptake protein HemP